MDSKETVTLEESISKSSQGSQEPRNDEPTNQQSSPLRKAWAPHIRKIILACGLIIVPMVVFTIVLLALVFSNNLDKATCPYPDLCPSPKDNNTSKAYYLVDFPAARLVFISSWSSTISFSLTGILMAIYSYSVAHQMMQTSASENNNQSLPSPYQTSILVRVLNAEILALWDLGCRKVKAVFWDRDSTSSNADVDLSRSHILRMSILVFIYCIFGSVLIQAADTYLHIATESANLVQIHPRDSNTHYFSRGLSASCLDRKTMGSMNNKNFWSCGMSYDPNSRTVVPSNRSTIYTTDHQTASRTMHSMFNYTTRDGIQYSIIGPSDASQETDWQATSFGISTQCSAIPAAACELSDLNNTTPEAALRTFSCSKEKGGIDLAGNITKFFEQRHYLDFNKYVNDSAPFSQAPPFKLAQIKDIVPNVTEEETNDVFRNPWNWVAALYLKREGESNNPGEVFTEDDRVIHTADDFFFMLLRCNSTVYDVTYSAIRHEVTSMAAQKANGSLTGISSMTSIYGFGFLNSFFNTMVQEAIMEDSPDKVISAYELGSSRVLNYPIAAQSEPRPSHLVQERISKVLTKLPKAALWVLVAANLAFALSGFGLAVFAIVATSPNVHQIQTRLGVAGLAAALFEEGFADRQVTDDSELFVENVDKAKAVKKVGVKRTDTGGSAFTIMESKNKATVIEKK